MKSRVSSLLRLSMHLSLGLLLLLGLCLGLGVMARPAYAGMTITVSTCDQSHLDAAIAQANSDNAGDTITFSCSGDILLTSTLTISGSMTLDSSGQSVTLDGGHSVQVLQVLSSVSLTLKALTVANGSTSFEGGGIFNAGTVSLSSSTLSANSAFAGGGIYNNGGMLTISNSTLSTNSADEAGGIFNEGGTVSITKSTLSANSAHRDGGGIYNTGTVSLSNSTLSSNSASNGGGGIANVSGTVKISRSTLSANSAFAGGGIYNAGTLSSSGSIVAENSAPQGTDCFGTITNQGYNLESGTDCGFTGKGSLQNVSNAQLALAALANNGGPTQTMALQQGSVAIDRIPKVKCPATDQRGEPRPDAGENKCDMGAYESNF